MHYALSVYAMLAIYTSQYYHNSEKKFMILVLQIS
jgi:hypothetical protein